MRHLFLVFIFSITGSSVIGQKADTIEIKKSFGTRFRKEGKNLTPRELLNIMQPVPQAYDEMKVAKTNYDVGLVIGCAGGFMVGWPLGAALAGRDPDWALAGVGAGLIVISIPLTSAYNKHAKAAVHLYNDATRKSTLGKVNFKIRPYGTGLSFQIKF